MILICKILSPLHPRMCLKLAMWFWGRRFLYLVNVLSLFRNYLPWVKSVVHHFKKNLSSPHSIMLPSKFVWNWLSDSEGEDFLISSMYFHYFVMISLWKRAWPFFSINWNPLHPRMFCSKLVEIGHMVMEKKNLNFVKWMYFNYFVIISPWKRMWPSIDQTWIHFTKDVALNWSNLNPLHQGCFMPSLFGWNWPNAWFWRRWTIRIAHLSFQLRWAKNVGVSMPEALYCSAHPFIFW